MIVRLMNLYRFFHIRDTIVRAYWLMRRADVPIALKITTAVLALLIVSPLNVLGDIPLLGIIDDVALMSLLLGWFARAAERRQAMQTIDGTEIVAR